MKILLLTAVCCTILKFNLGTRCMDEQNNTVDWFYMYKFPQIKHEPKLIKSGLAYMYLTSNNFKEWTLSMTSILNQKSMLGLTLAPLITNQDNIYHILYNDQPPNRKGNSKKGHTKGTVLLDKSEGFWLIHSVPHFPNISDRFFPITGIEYGQSFLCISLNYTNLDKVGVQLRYNQPLIYSQNLPVNLIDSLPNLYSTANGATIQDSPWHNLINITTIDGVEFVSFAKSRQFAKDLYSDFIAPYLSSNFYVSSWLNNPKVLPSDCTKSHDVWNVKAINVTDFYLNFNNSVDHSKWAVSDCKSYWTCVGDINHNDSQKKRGGGSLCLSNKKISNAYRHIIQDYEKCKT